MTRQLSVTMLFLLLAFVGCADGTNPVSQDPSSGEQVQRGEGPVAEVSEPLPRATEPLDGFILIAPLRSNETYLLNEDKQVVHRWTSDYPPAASAYLLENGDLLRTARDPEFTHFHGGGIGTLVERFNWDGELVWSFQYATKDHCRHHDIAPMPNGNILMIAWERKSKQEAIDQGRDPELLGDDLWPDCVIEVEPDGATGGKIVWEWHMWDHLIQDFDREKPNYGVIYEHPELIDLNNTGSTPPATPEELRKLRAVGYTGGGDDDDGGGQRSADWLHTNGIDYNPELDQIALSAKNFSEIWIIDHSTTTEEAAEHRGGRWGKGGDLLYRWGNPWSYKSGTADDKMLFDQHDVRWIPPGFPGAGHLTAFNNGSGREYSSIPEVAPPFDREDGYLLDDEGRFGPYELEWEYTAEEKTDFYSSFISGAARLQNGNTMICEGATGRFFEVNSEGQILWQHINTLGGELDMDGRPQDVDAAARKAIEGKGSFVENNALFRAIKFPLEYSAFAGRELQPLAEQPVPFSQKVEEAIARIKAEEPEAAAEGQEAEQEADAEANADEESEEAAS